MNWKGLRRKLQLSEISLCVTAGSRVLLEKLTFTHPAKKILDF
jgi:hypothetical protein